MGNTPGEVCAYVPGNKRVKPHFIILYKYSDPVHGVQKEFVKVDRSERYLKGRISKTVQPDNVKQSGQAPRENLVHWPLKEVTKTRNLTSTSVLENQYALDHRLRRITNLHNTAQKKNRNPSSILKDVKDEAQITTGQGDSSDQSN